MSEDTPEARLARWTERDVAIGLVAEVEQLRAALAERDREIANIRERSAQLALRVTALEVERNALAGLVARAQRPTLTRRLYRRGRGDRRAAAPAMTPVVSVIVPSIGTRGTVHGRERVFVVDSVRSVLATAAMPVEVLVVAGREMPAEVAMSLAALGDAVHLVGYDAAFNFSATVDLGAAYARGEHLLLLNDDTEVVSPDWLTAMVDAGAVAIDGQPVGAVGAKLLFEDGTLQHAGHTYRTSLDHVGFGLPGDSAGRHGILSRRRRVAGVTAACMLTPYAVFDAVGGFSTSLPGNYNDVDYCMKLRAAGYAVVYEPAAVLHHFESRSRVAGILPSEIELIQRRWLTHLTADPFTPAAV